MGKPRTVKSVKKLDLVVVSYDDQNGNEVSQFAFTGDNNIVLLNTQALLGIGQKTPAGFATGWLREQMLSMLGHEDVSEQAPTTSTSIPFEEVG